MRREQRGTGQAMERAEDSPLVVTRGAGPHQYMRYHYHRPLSIPATTCHFPPPMHRWVREELHRWVFDNVRTKWAGVLRKPSRLPELFSGYRASKALVYEVGEEKGGALYGSRPDGPGSSMAAMPPYIALLLKVGARGLTEGKRGRGTRVCIR